MARTRVIRGRVGMVALVVAILLSSGPPPRFAAAQSTSVTIPAAEVTRALYQANWLHTYTEAERPKQLMALLLAQYAYEVIPGLPPNSTIRLIDRFRAAYDRRLASGVVAQDYALTSSLLHLADRLDQGAPPTDDEVAAEVRALQDARQRVAGPLQAGLPVGDAGSAVAARAVDLATLSDPAHMKLYGALADTTLDVLAALALQPIPLVGQAAGAALVIKAFRDGYRVGEAIDEIWYGSGTVKSAPPQDFNPRQVATLKRIINAAAPGSPLAVTIDATHEGKLGVKVGATTLDILTARPDLASPQLAALLRQSGDLATSLADLKALTDQQFADLETILQQDTAMLVAIDAKMGDLLAYAQDAALRTQQEDAAKRRATELQLQIDAASANVYILSTLVGFVDPELGRQTAVVGTATIQIVTAVNNYLASAASLGGIGVALGGAVLTGNILGAAMSLTSLFAGASPTPDQLILAQIAALRQQLAAFQAQMNQRFDRIDATLNAIYAGLSQQLAQLQRDVAMVQRQLVDLYAQLNRLDMDLTLLLNVLGSRDLILAMELNLGLPDKGITGDCGTHPADCFSYKDYLSALQTFHTWAVSFAADPLETGPAYADFSDAGLANRLALPLDRNIAYLARWLENRGFLTYLDTRSGATIVNPRTFAVASTAFAQLQLEWPEYTKRLLDQPDGARMQQEIAAVGVDLQHGLRNIVVDSVTGHGNYALFDQLLGAQRTQVLDVGSRVSVLEWSYLKQHHLEIWNTRVQPWETANQRPQGHYPAGFKKEYPAYFDGRQDVPAAVVSAIPACEGGDQHYDLLGFDSVDPWFPSEFNALLMHDLMVKNKPLTMCYSAERIGGSAAVFDLAVTVWVRFDGVALFHRTITKAGARCWKGDPYYWLSGCDGVVGWKDELYAQFPTASSFADDLTPLTRPAYTAAQLEVERTLQGLRAELASMIVGEFDTDEGEGNAVGLRTLARALDGTKGVVVALCSLGLPQAMRRDDLLAALLSSGTQSLIDARQIRARYAALLAGPIGPADNPRLWMRSKSEERVNVLARWLDAYLDQVAKGTVTEELRLVDDALIRVHVSGQMAPLIADLSEPAPSVGGGERCFPGFTRYCVSGLFRQQWEEEGGLAINGYPLTGEIPEVLPNEQNIPTVYTVQYFERVRMERHTDAGTGQPIVLLGQFGRALHPAEPPVAQLPGAVYFADTGHNVTRPEFAAYWATNGGLAQFGFPLGEEQDETLTNAKGELTVYRVQYFERARFEWHPENAGDQRVQLGQFGRAVCGERCR